MRNWGRKPGECVFSDVSLWFENAQKKCHCICCGSTIQKGMLRTRFIDGVRCDNVFMRLFCTKCTISLYKDMQKTFRKAKKHMIESGAFI